MKAAIDPSAERPEAGLPTVAALPGRGSGGFPRQPAAPGSATATHPGTGSVSSAQGSKSAIQQQGLAKQGPTQADATIQLRTGRRIPSLGLGTWQLTHETAATVAEALALGYRMIDTSSDYGTQRGIGEAIARAGVDREALYVVTKVEESDDAYPAARQYVSEIGLEYVDLLLIHRPPAGGAGIALWDGLIRAQQEGLARDIGVSNYRIEQIDELAASSGVTPAVNQIEWSPFGHSNPMLEYCRERQIVIQAYSPLTRAERLADPALRRLADHHGKTPAQLLIRWNLQRGVVPVPKTNRRKHLEENIDVFDFVIGEDDMAALDGLNEHYSALGTLAYV